MKISAAIPDHDAPMVSSSICWYNFWWKDTGVYGVIYRELSEGEKEALSGGIAEFLAHVANEEHEKCDLRYNKFLAHVANEEHEKCDLRYNIICIEDNLFKRWGK